MPHETWCHRVPTTTRRSHGCHEVHVHQLTELTDGTTIIPTLRGKERGFDFNVNVNVYVYSPDVPVSSALKNKCVIVRKKEINRNSVSNQLWTLH